MEKKFLLEKSDKHTFFPMKIQIIDLWMQIEVRKLIFIMNFSVLRFLQICLQNASNCTDFSLDFQNFPGEHAPGPP